jgi:hypothetical protein
MAMVNSGRMMIVSEHIEGPVGRHGFKAVCTRTQLLYLQGVYLEDLSREAPASGRFLNPFTSLNEKDWRENTRELRVLDR